MQETRYDGRELMSEVGDIEKEFKRALEDQRNASVAVHKPGVVFKSKGRWYYVDPERGLRRVSWFTAMKLRKAAE